MNSKKHNFIDLFKIKKKIKRLKFKLIIGIFILFLLIAAVSATGIIAVNSFEPFLNEVAIFLSDENIDKKDIEIQNWINNMTAQELLTALNNNTFVMKKSSFDHLKIKRRDFLYLLNLCTNYENQGKQTREVTVEMKHIYTTLEEYDEVVGQDESGNDVTETITESVQHEKIIKKVINVSNVETEGLLSMDWRTLYLFSLINSADPTRPKTKTMFSFLANWINPQTSESPNLNNLYNYSSADDNGYHINKRDIDQAFELLSMHYDYAFDVLRDSRTFYSYTECQQLPHSLEVLGDPNTETGQYTTYYPKSLINSGYSGYSDLYYVVNGSTIIGIQEQFNLIRFNEMGLNLCSFYSDEYFQILSSLLPGGNRIYEKFRYYQHQAKNGNNVIYNGNFLIYLGGFNLSEGQTVLDGNAIGPNYGNSNNLGADGIYSPPVHVGEAAVNLAMTRLNWSYTQNVSPSNGPTRTDVGYWDCSSMIGRLYNELGVGISAGATTLTLQNNADKYAQKINESEMIPGDVYWLSSGSGRHVVMYCGNGMVLHAKGVKYGTIYESVQQWKTSNSKELKFCFRPYLGLSNTWTPPSIGMGSNSSGYITAADFALLTENEVAEKILALAIEDSKNSYILPSITAAQMILESGFVKSGLAVNANNCFGMKASLSGNLWPNSVWDGVSIYQSWTWEEDGSGKRYQVLADFRSYPTIEDSISDHSAYLLGAKKGNQLRYSGLTNAINFTDAITIIKNGGYATDTQYIQKVTNVINKYNLARFDDTYININSNVDNGTTSDNKIYLNNQWEFAEFSKIDTGYAVLYQSHAINSKRITIAINAGHGTKGGSNVKTQCHPDGSPKVTGGTTGIGAITAVAVSSGTTFLNGDSEASVTLSLAQILKDQLIADGYDVLMIRDADDVQLDNIARTVIANNVADCHIALHWDSTGSDKGAFYMSVPDIVSYRTMDPVRSHWQDHHRLGDYLIQGLRENGISIFSSRSMAMDLTQTSYSTIPSVDIELGDRASDHSLIKLHQLSGGLVDGINYFYNN